MKENRRQTLARFERVEDVQKDFARRRKAATATQPTPASKRKAVIEAFTAAEAAASADKEASEAIATLKAAKLAKRAEIIANQADYYQIIVINALRTCYMSRRTWHGTYHCPSS